MNRPDVRMVQNQEEISSREVTGHEAEALLAKYGYGNQNFSTRQEPVVEQQPIANDLTFEEMLRLEDEKRHREEMLKMSKLNGPKPITFSGGNGYDSEVKYGAEDGFGFKIEISTDMKLPRY